MSVAGNDGKYSARLYFEPPIDARAARKLVQGRVALAEPQLPEEVRRLGVALKGQADANPGAVVIVVRDCNGSGWEALQKAGAAVEKHLVS